MSLRDMRTKYSCTIVPINGKICYVEGIQEYEGSVYSFATQMLKDNNWTACVVKAKEDGIDPTPPKLGLINTKKSVVYLSRIAERQWKRGYSLETTNLVSPVKPMIQALGWKTPRASEVSIVNEVFNRTFAPDLRMLVKNLLEPTNKVLARAFDYNWFISVSPYKKDELLLGYKQYMVGRVINDEFVLHPKCAHLKEELAEKAPTFAVLIGG